jgi:hypothetical protein
VALSYLNGDIKRTFRIVGQIQNILPPFSGVLSRNYAYVKEGEWVGGKVIKNGQDWSRSMFNQPVSRWNAKDAMWSIIADGQDAMPLLNRLSGQETVPLP